jgi:hypothetical protein
VRLVLDAKEQRVQRPHGVFDAQRPYYSGKKKTHTLKNQFGVGPDGLIESVSASVPGGATPDVMRLRQTGGLGHWSAGEGARVDQGYVSIAKDYPTVPWVISFKASRNHPLTDEQKAFNRVVARYRIVVEPALAQLDRFTVRRQVFRGRCWGHSTAHSQVVRVVARLVNRRMGVCPLKTYASAA